MSDEISIRSEDEPVWSSKDVEESLLLEEMNSPKRGHKTPHHIYFRFFPSHLIISFCSGALFAFITLNLAWITAIFGSQSDDSQWSTPPLYS